MASKLDKIGDEELRGRLGDVHAQLRANEPTDAVRALADIFVSMLTARPDVLAATVPVRGGRQMPLVMRWPNLGANLDPGSVREGTPKITFERERFALSEALTYYEFTVDTAIENGF